MNMEKNLHGLITRDEEIDLLGLLSLFYANKYKIIVTTLGFVLLAFIYTNTQKPVYNASVLIQVEKNTPNNLISRFLSPFEMNSSSTSTEIGILTSRRVLNQTIADLDLQTEVVEQKLPIIGTLLSWLQGNNVNRISVAQFDVPPEYEDESWTLTILSPDSYRLSLKGKADITGKTQQIVSEDGVTVNIAKIAAPAGATFTLIRHSRFNVTRELLRHLTAVEQGKESGLLNVTFSGDDKQENIRILNSISRNYMKDNIARKAEETSKSLEFVNNLLPGTQERLRRADRKLHEFMQLNGSIDLPMEAKNILSGLVELQAQQNELQLARIELSRHYTPEHPLYRSLIEKEALLEKEKRELNQRIASIPKTQQDYLSIKRDVEADQAIYMQLLSKQQELSIAKASTVANVRIVDEAVSDPLPTGRKQGLILLLGAMLGVIVSYGWCMLMYILRVPLEDTKIIEKRGVSVLVSVPLSKWLHAKTRHLKQDEHPGLNEWLCTAHPEDLSIEALRSLRTGIFISLLHKQNNSIMISSATPGAGKTFISSNLAAVMADTGKRILLIDADLRRGYLHELLGMRKARGLADILKGKLDVVEAIQHSSHSGLDFISTGESTAKSSELLMSQHFVPLLAWAQQQYDYVIIDTPPILPITDAAIVAQHVGLTLLVLRYKSNNLQDLDIALSRFAKCDVRLDGVVFNAVLEGSPSAYGYSNYSTPL